MAYRYHNEGDDIEVRCDASDISIIVEDVRDQKVSISMPPAEAMKLARWLIGTCVRMGVNGDG